MSNPLTAFAEVRLTGIEVRSGQMAFPPQNWVLGPQSVTFEPKINHLEDAEVDLGFLVRFPDRNPIQGNARVRNVKDVTLRLATPRMVDAAISHLPLTPRQCYLLCFENGATSDGPCLTCPDGEYQLRICC